MRALRRLLAELAYLAGLARLEARMARMAGWEVREELAWLEARRSRRLAGR